MTTDHFKLLLNSRESSVLDFKSSMYDFNQDNDLLKTAKFVKDIISFSNTIRNESSFIITGVEEKPDGEKVLHGLDSHIDDSILQNKVKDKVFPRPHFRYYTINYENKVFGIFEFPVQRHEAPMAPIQKMKGLEIGKIYYRHGTTNAEASGIETINIYKWLQSIPRVTIKKSWQDETFLIIKRLSMSEEKLSGILSDLLRISDKYNLPIIKKFCTEQLKGLTAAEVDANPEDYNYRIQEVIISLNRVEVNPYSFAKVTPQMVQNELLKNKDFFKFRMMFTNPLYEIEENKDRKDGFNIVTVDAKHVIPETSIDTSVYVYVFQDTFISLYKSIRQMAIDLLMKI